MPLRLGSARLETHPLPQVVLTWLTRLLTLKPLLTLKLVLTLKPLLTLKLLLTLKRVVPTLTRLLSSERVIAQAGQKLNLTPS